MFIVKQYRLLSQHNRTDHRHQILRLRIRSKILLDHLRHPFHTPFGRLPIEYIVLRQPATYPTQDVPSVRSHFVRNVWQQLQQDVVNGPYT